MKLYILTKDGKIRTTSDVLKWGKAFTNTDRVIAKTQVEGVKVSTIFLGMDYNFLGNGSKPHLFETMIFGSKRKAFRNYQVRYATKKEAEEGHKYAVQFVTRYFTKKMLKKL